MRLFIYTILLVALPLLGGCKYSGPTITVTNPLDADRVIETVELKVEDLKMEPDQIIIVDAQSGEEVSSQLVDRDGDKQPDYVLFQVQLKGKESRTYHAIKGEHSVSVSEVKTFARFVPERTDDFAWENDMVAFRTYGPEAQRMVEENIPGGTLSSGIDCWLKKVDYSIIDKWYKGNTENAGYYHQDHGEGLDNYHVGPSRGCGGTGVLLDGKLVASKNFVSHKTLTNGPVETCFELDYAPYQAGDKTIKERKVISIDLGSNLTKYVIYVEGADTLTTGITLHDKQGAISSNEAAGWTNYYAPHFGEELSTGIVAHPKYFAGFSEIDSEMKDESHALIHLKVIDGKVEFYSGFYWSASKQFANNSNWEEYLNVVAQCLKEPLRVDVN